MNNDPDARIDGPEGNAPSKRQLIFMGSLEGKTNEQLADEAWQAILKYREAEANQKHGYTEVTVVWDSAVDSDEMFPDDQSDTMDRYISGVQRDASQLAADSVEIYTLHHDHSMYESDCECGQPVTAHHPFWRYP